MYKTVSKKNGKVPSKMAEETPRNKICVDLIGPSKIRRIGKEPLILKSIIFIDPVTGWFEVMKYCDKKAMTIVNLVETTLLVRYSWSVEITYDQVGEFLSHEFKNRLIKTNILLRLNLRPQGNHRQTK